MDRRAFLWTATAVSFGVAGCTSGPVTGDGAAGTPTQVSTSSADGIEIIVSQIAIPTDATGPNAYYRFTNAAESDATIKVETVLAIDGGGSYRSFAYVDVPAGDEVTAQYLIVSFDQLSEAEERSVRQGEGVDFSVFINGQERQDV